MPARPDVPPPSVAVPQLDQQPFHAVLDAGLAHAAGLAKGERTRLRLIAAAAQVLERDGFHALRVTDVCEIAGVSQGTFYLYFPNKTQIAAAVLTDFNEQSLTMLRTQGPRERAWDAIHGSVLIMVRIYRLNPGLMRCLFQISDDTPEFGEILRRSNAVWMRAVARSIVRRCGLGDEAGSLPLFFACALSAMVDQLLVQLYITRDPQVEALVGGEEEVTEYLSILWYRAVYRADPPADALKFARSLAGFTLH